MRKNEETQTTNLIRTIGILLAGGIFALSIVLVFLFLCSICISRGWISDGAMMQYSVVACLIGGFIGALSSIKRIRTKKLIIGILTSVIQFFLMLTIGFLLYPGVSILEHGITIAVACIAGGAISGFICGKQKKKRRK